MKIYSNPCVNINFGTNHRWYKGGRPNEKIYTASWVNRGDLRFDDLADFMVSEYAKASKVNVFSLACSDGSEAWTLDMFLREHKNVDKFFPIIGVDIDSGILACANSKLLNVKDSEIESLRDSGVDFYKYFDKYSHKMHISRDSLDSETKTYIAKDFIKNDFIAHERTVLQQIRRLDNEAPNVVLCRNFFPYLNSESECYKYIQNIANALAKNDIFVIGDYDRGKEFLEVLKKFKFAEVHRNIFKLLK